MLFNKKKKKGLGTKIKELFVKNALDDNFYDSLEELLLTSDVGALSSIEILDEFQSLAKEKKIQESEELIKLFKNILKDKICSINLEPEKEKVNIFLVLGVNGVGKTTSIAKLSQYYRKNGIAKDFILAAGDTFRAAAIDQLKFHGEKLGIPVISHQSGSDPAAVIYDAVQSALAKGSDLVIADTAGRMHNKENLVAELQKIARIIEKQTGNASIKKILVLDATTGQNGISQAEIFHEAVGIDAIILTKYDSLSKGGIAITISRRLGIPFAFVGTGEKYDDFSLFDVDSFIDRILEE